MTVEELIEILKMCPKNYEVIIEHDVFELKDIDTVYTHPEDETVRLIADYY